MAHRTHRRQHKKMMRLRELEKSRHPMMIARLIDDSMRLRDDLFDALAALHDSAYSVLVPPGCTFEILRPNRKLKRNQSATD